MNFFVVVVVNKLVTYVCTSKRISGCSRESCKIIFVERWKFSYYDEQTTREHNVQILYANSNLKYTPNWNSVSWFENNRTTKHKSEKQSENDDDKGTMWALGTMAL